MRAGRAPVLSGRIISCAVLLTSLRGLVSYRQLYNSGGMNAMKKSPGVEGLCVQREAVVRYIAAYMLVCHTVCARRTRG